MSHRSYALDMPPVSPGPKPLRTVQMIDEDGYVVKVRFWKEAATKNNLKRDVCYFIRGANIYSGKTVENLKTKSQSVYQRLKPLPSGI